MYGDFERIKDEIDKSELGESGDTFMKTHKNEYVNIDKVLRKFEDYKNTIVCALLDVSKSEISIGVAGPPPTLSNTEVISG